MYTENVLDKSSKRNKCKNKMLFLLHKCWRFLTLQACHRIEPALYSTVGWSFILCSSPGCRVPASRLISVSRRICCSDWRDTLGLLSQLWAEDKLLAVSGFDQPNKLGMWFVRGGQSWLCFPIYQSGMRGNAVLPVGRHSFQERCAPRLVSGSCCCS